MSVLRILAFSGKCLEGGRNLATLVLKSSRPRSFIFAKRAGALFELLSTRSRPSWSRTVAASESVKVGRTRRRGEMARNASPSSNCHQAIKMSAAPLLTFPSLDQSEAAGALHILHDRNGHAAGRVDYPPQQRKGFREGSNLSIMDEQPSESGHCSTYVLSVPLGGQRDGGINLPRADPCPSDLSRG